MKTIYIAVYRAQDTTQVLEAFTSRQDAETYRDMYLHNIDNKNWYTKFRLKVMNSRSETIAIIRCNLYEADCKITNPKDRKI